MTVNYYRNQTKTDTEKVTKSYTAGVANQKFETTSWTKKGFKFLGWSENRNATTATYTQGQAITDAIIDSKNPTLTLYGVWQCDIVLQYSSHISNIGDQAWKTSPDTSGVLDTTGNVIEKFRMYVTGTGLTTNFIQFKTHTYGIGDSSSWVNADQTYSGLTGQGNAVNGVEAIYIQLTDYSYFDIEYRVYVNGEGWSAWSKNGNIAGTTGQSKTINGIQVRLVERTSEYNITYQLNGGTDPGNPDGYDKTSNNITLNNPTKSGYVFAGWTGTGLSERVLNVTIPKGSTGHRTYTANWKKIEDVDDAYFNCNGVAGWIGDVNPNGSYVIFMNYGSEFLLPTWRVVDDFPSAEWHHSTSHGAWQRGIHGFTYNTAYFMPYKSNALATHAYWLAWGTSATGDPSTKLGDVNNAYYVYPPITFTANGGTGSNFTLSTATIGTNIKDVLIAKKADYTRTGYTFLGWSKTQDGDVLDDFGIAGATTLYAQWAKTTANAN